ncbi:TPA: glycine zipper family protein [Klebsiella pneumoniae]|nr:glycine zipper family protein [Klebsiella pneumoniae]
MKKCVVLRMAILSTIVLAGCVSPPRAPTVMALPGSAKTYESFQHDDVICRNAASLAVGGESNNANNNGVATAVAGTAIGAATGALIGSVGGPRGAASGVAVGAASGLLVGSAIASNDSGGAHRSLQDQYNVTYVQCMYAKGNKIPQAYTWDEPENANDVPPDYHS